MNFKNIKSNKMDKNVRVRKVTGDEQMEKIIIITGMMCAHCEARVKKALEALPEVKEVEVSHERGTAIVKLYKDISSDVLKKTVEEQDYTVNNVI